MTLPKEPSPGLLMSMAMRYDHGLGLPGYYDFFGEGDHEMRLNSAIGVMRQLYEEVSGHGFYSPDKENEYAEQLDPKIGIELARKRAQSVALDETICQKLARLEHIMKQVEDAGMDGNMLAQRITGDLHRIMNSAWLNCSDLIHRHERQKQAPMPLAAKAAMEYAINTDEGITFLKLWQEGDFEAIRREWPDAPETIYVDKDLVL